MNDVNIVMNLKLGGGGGGGGGSLIIYRISQFQRIQTIASLPLLLLRKLTPFP